MGASLSEKVDPWTLVLVLSAFFLIGLFCLPASVGKFIMVPSLAGLAAVGWWRFPDGAHGRGRMLHRPDVYFLLLAAIWTVVNVVATGPAPRVLGELEANVILMFFLALAANAILDAGAFPSFMRLIVALATVEALISMGLQVADRGLVSERLFSFGRAANPIPAAGGYAVALIASVALLQAPQAGSKLWKVGYGLCVGVLLAALVWSASRSPLFSLIASLALSSLWPLRNRPLRLFAKAMLVWVVLVAFVVFETDIRTAVCSYGVGRICAESLRLDVWGWVLEGIKTHPFAGLGFDFRFPGDRPHAHNGLAALALGAGVPFLVAFLALCLAVSALAARLPADEVTWFCAQAFVFAFGYMATDLPNPVGFINTHYLFLWLPIFTICARQQRQRAPSPPLERDEFRLTHRVNLNS